MLCLPGCGLEPDRLFQRNAPQVDRAIDALDAGEPQAAADLLQAYLGTGACEGGDIGVSDLARSRPNASFDLGLALFRLGEQYGMRFGEYEQPSGEEGPTAEQQQLAEVRGHQVTCALKVLRAMASSDLPPALTARAKYLEGNLEFLRRQYREAVRAYDESLRWIPGVAADAGMDEIGRDAAWNRAIALRRIEENERDAGSDAQDNQDASDDGSSDSDSGAQDGGEDGPQESGDGGRGDQPPDSGAEDSSPDSDEGSSQQDEEEKPEEEKPEEEPPPPEPQTQDDRVLDKLEAAPTLQLEDVRRNAARRRVPGMVDK